MSRVGKHAIEIPASVKVEFQNGVVSGKSTLGSFSHFVPECIKVTLQEKDISFAPGNEDKHSIAMWGTMRAVISKAIIGLVKPFEKKINMVGVGYKASVQGNKLIMQLGFSHDIEFDIPSDVKIVCEKPTTIVVQGCDSQRVGQVVKQLQNYRKPEPYKGKGMIIEGQYVYRKEGKKK